MELCDLDLANLALPYYEYSYWSDLAIEEATEIYKTDKKTLLRAQVDFCRRMLKRKRLYYKRYEWEAPARENLMQKLIELRGK